MYAGVFVCVCESLCCVILRACVRLCELVGVCVCWVVWLLSCSVVWLCDWLCVFVCVCLCVCD